MVGDLGKLAHTLLKISGEGGASLISWKGACIRPVKIRVSSIFACTIFYPYFQISPTFLCAFFCRVKGDFYYSRRQISHNQVYNVTHTRAQPYRSTGGTPAILCKSVANFILRTTNRSNRDLPSFSILHPLDLLN